MNTRYALGLLGLIILILPLASAQTVNVMQHICAEDIQSRADFEALGSFAEKVLACPTTVLLNDTAAPETITSEQTSFDYHVEDRSGVQTINDTSFVQQALCESDIQTDLNEDGNISNETCLDTSMYSYEVEGFTTLIQIAPENTRFGTLAFTPSEITTNTDMHTLAYLGGEGYGIIQVDPTRDALDNTTTLHIYNFQTPNTNGTDNMTENATMEATLQAQFLQANNFTCTDHTAGEECELLNDTIRGDCRAVAFAEHNSSTLAIQARACPTNVSLEVYREVYASDHRLEVCMTGVCIDSFWGFREGPINLDMEAEENMSAPPTNVTENVTDNATGNQS